MKRILTALACAFAFAMACNAQMTAARMMAFASTGGGLSAKSYVQDGLVAMWDGIENDGWGKHDPNATVWKDLIGDCDLTSQNLITYHVETDSFRWDRGATFGNTSATQIYDIITSGGAYSIEVVYKISSTDNQNGSLFGISDSRSFWMFANLNVTIQSDRFDTFTAANFGSGKLNEKLALSFSNGSVFGNGTLIGTTARSITRRTGSSVFQIGRLPGFGAGMVGNHYSVRVYSRALTAAEIAHNFGVDKARFRF